MIDVLLALTQQKVNEAVKKYIREDEIIKSAIANTLTAVVVNWEEVGRRYEAGLKG